jgi:hypothetical protein
VTSPQVLTFDNPDGSQAQVTIGYAYTPPPPPPDPMLVGVDISQTGGATADVASLKTHVALFPGCVGPTKVFASAGKGLPSWTAGVLGAVPSTWIPYACFKDFPTQAAWLAWLTAIPTRWREVWATYDQEMEGDQPASQYVARFQQLLTWAAGHPNRGRIKLGPNFTWYAETHKGYDWHDYWPGAQCDFIGWDLYPAGKSNWLAADQLQAEPVASAAEVGRPLVYPEIGVVTDTPQTTAMQQARAAWMTSQVAYARAHGVRAVSWWCGTGSQGNFHLDSDPDGLDAWRSEINK